jgi:predicted ATPase
MPDTPHHRFISTALDSKYLLTPFATETNWHVITGAPSCGKTTLINLLAIRGFQTVPECARQYMESELARGRSISEIHDDAPTLQRRIVAMQRKIENQLSATDFAFLDGAVPGSLSWYRACGLKPNDILPECFYHRYASVFVLDRLPLQLDGFRFKDDALTGFLDKWIARDYMALGYDVIRVPVLAPEERLAFVLGTLSERGFDYPGHN